MPFSKDTKLDRKAYLARMAASRFTLSPAGMGYDCHRHWEAVLVGTVPVLQDRGWHARTFAGLPVLAVPNLATDATREALAWQYARVACDAARHWHFEMLTRAGWVAWLRASAGAGALLPVAAACA